MTGKICKQTKLWKTRAGTKIRICDMTDKHLNNTIKMMFRSYEAMLYKEWGQLMSYFESDPPDGAYMAASGELGDLEGILWGTACYNGPDLEERAERDLPILRKMLLDQLRRKNVNRQVWDSFIDKLKGTRCLKKKKRKSTN
ncbi:hypothetical protein KAR91_62470 [Candidatus Pacearchaeota archaeon]|nr:hypothetical protein [Candidatus Pacearchaeota archaeon]